MHIHRTGTHWERVDAQSQTHYIDINTDEVVVGSHGNTPDSDHAASCSLEAFRLGALQETVVAHFSAEIFEEVLKALGVAIKP